MHAHGSFDKLWQLGVVADRKAAYRELEAFLGVGPSDAHIGHLNEPKARAVMEWADGLLARSRAEGWNR